MSDQAFAGGVAARARNPRIQMMTTPVQALRDRDIQQMWALYGPHHDSTPQEVESRIRGGALGQVHRFFRAEELAGFFGMREDVLDVEQVGRVGCVYVGLAWIAPEHRRKHLVQKAILRRLAAFRLQNPRMPLYFWIDALTYKPYLVMVRNNRDVQPQRGRHHPAAERVRNHLGQRFYGAAYRDGVVHKAHKRVRSGVADVTPEELADPDIAFYAQANPGHARGDGLLVVLPGTFANLRHYAGRMVKRALRLR